MKTVSQLSLGALSAILLVLSFWFSSVFNSRTEDEEMHASRSGAYQALDFWSRSRAYPAADVSPDAYYQAYEYSKLHIPEMPTRSSSPATWEFIGPINFSGRMISIAINPSNPNTIYTGSAGGGLWRSFTGGLGADWHSTATGFPVLGVNAISIDPSDTNIIHIGTGEVYRYGGSIGGMVVRATRGSYGMGILKTTDGGTTWSKTLDWSYNQERGVQAIRINPLNRNTMLAATSEGVYRSVDGGNNWTEVLSVLMARDIAINPDDTTEVLATCGNFASADHGVYRSKDGGVTFSQVAGLPGFSGMAVLGTYQTNPERIYVHLAESTTVIGTTYRSTDFGVNWTLVNTSTTGDVQGWYARFLAVHPTDSSKIVRGAQGLWRSTNGGTSFSQIIQGWADYHAFANHPTNPEILYMVDDGGVWRSTNFGTTFTSASGGLRTSQFYNGFSSSASDSLRALGQVQDHFGWMYTGTTTWQSSGVDEVGWTAINQLNDFVMYAGSRGGGAIYKSTNRGTSFTSSSSGIIGGISAWNAPFVLSPSDPNYLYFGRSRIFKSTNAAATWTATNGSLDLDGNPALSMAMSSTNTDSVYVGTAPYVTRSHIFRTANGGTSWTDVTGMLPNRYPLDLAVDPNNSSTVYVAFGGADTSHLFKSTDGGGSWIDITGVLPDVPATAILIDPENSNYVYAGTDIGVYLSSNGGTDWFAFNEGLPEAAIISDLSISPGNRLLRAVTHSTGIYERAMAEIVTGQPPVVSDIPDQTIPLGGRFSSIRVDLYVADPDDPDSVITWTWTGNSSLTVRWDPVRRRIRVRSPNGWTGSETVIFTGTDPDGLSGNNAATFMVTPAGVVTPTLKSAKENVPSENVLFSNYPNPFNPRTEIGFQITDYGLVSLKAYDLLGREVATLVNEELPPGRYTREWDARAFPSGVYYYRLSAGEFVKTNKLLLSK